MTHLVYCDASVLVARLTRDDAHHDVTTLIDHALTHDGRLLSSELAWLEVSRAINRLASSYGDAASPFVTIEAAFDDIDLMALDHSVLAVAREIPDPHLGTLDAIHVATALMVGARLVLTRDRRMAQACSALGLAVA